MWTTTLRLLVVGEMALTGTYVNMSRSRLGPETEPALPTHRVRMVQSDKARFRGLCWCGWQSGRRRSASLAREALDAHILAEDVDAG